MKNIHYNTLSQNTRTPSRRLTGLPGLPALIRKPLSVVLTEAQQDKLVRHLTLFDLVIIGVARTMGSGIFALVGLIGSTYAGPGAIVSWVLAGICCVVSGLSYAELSSIIPSEGGAYAYAFVALGELPATITAWCLTLEFGISGAAVARNWADKILEWISIEGESSAQARFWGTVLNPLPCIGFSPLAAALQAVCVLVVLRGVNVGKQITTVLTGLKMAVCIFIVVAGLGLFDAKNLVPFAPTGMSGIVRGSAAAFFGYTGFEEVCALSGETINPRRDVPLSIAIIVAVVSAAYVLAATALTGMLPIMTVSERTPEPGEVSFEMAFAERGWIWAAEIAAVGELVSLPVVVLAAFFVQPRLLFVLAGDGLVPKSLSKTDEQGVLRNATIVSGVTMVIVAAIAPFTGLDDFISAGILLGFAVTNSSAIMMRRSHLDPILPGPCRPLVLLFNALCFIIGLLLRFASGAAVARAAAGESEGDAGGGGGGGLAAARAAEEATAATAAAILFSAAVLVMVTLSVLCPELPCPVGELHVFRAPLSPWIPSLGILLSWLMMAQLSWVSLQWSLCGILAVCAWYFTYGISHSVGQKSRSWPQLAALSAVRAASGQDSFLVSPPDTPPTAYNPRKLPSSSSGDDRGVDVGVRSGGRGRHGGGGSRRSNLRATFAGTPPQEGGLSSGGAAVAAGASGSGVALGSGGERQTLSTNSALSEEGYMSFAALTYKAGPE